MTDDVADDDFRDALRDLIPDYTGPVDPVPRVFASVRRRRLRQRTLLAVGGTGLAVALAVAAPALLLPRHDGGVRAAAPHAPGTVGGPVPTVYPVAAGVVEGADWAIGSTTAAAGAQHCLYSDDDVALGQLTCFTSWKPGADVEWSAEPLADKGLRITRITGVAPAGTATVRVRLRSAAPRTLPTATTPTDRSARFFGTVLPGTVDVLDVTALDPAGAPLGDPVGPPGSVCTTSPDRLCPPPK